MTSDNRKGRGGWLRFTKMHGLGNDFMVIDAITQPVQLSADQIRRMGDRHLGLGLTSCCWWSPRSVRMWISVIGFLTPMAVKWNSAVMARAVLPVSSMTRD